MSKQTRTVVENNRLITSKANSASPTFSGTVVLPNTTSIGTVSATELGYVDGVTAALQGQIDGATNIPAGFRAKTSAYQYPTSNVWTKVTVNTETFDIGNMYDAVTNFRFTPTKAGYYQLSAIGTFNATTTLAQYNSLVFFKNGVNYTVQGTTTAGAAVIGISDIVYLNGTTDCVELYTNIQGGSGAYIGIGSTFAAIYIGA